MSPSLHGNALRRSVASYAESLNAPRPNIAAIRARAARIEATQERHSPKRPRRTILILAVAGLLVAATPSLPMIVAGVQRIVSAWVVVNGKVMHARTEVVTLAQARADVPFRVIEPAPIPPNLRASITEITPSSDRRDAQIWFQYEPASGPDGGRPVPALTVIEVSPQSPWAPMLPGGSASRSPRRVGPGQGFVVAQAMGSGRFFTVGATIAGTGPSKACVAVRATQGSNSVSVRPCGAAPPPLSPRAGCRRITASGGVSEACYGPARSGTVRVLHPTPPLRFIVRGTLIVILDPQGTLSRQQTRALRAGMSQ